MGLEVHDDATRPRWGVALGIAIPLFMLSSAAGDAGSGGASTVLGLLGFGALWACAAKGKTARAIRSVFSGQRRPASGRGASPPRWGNLRGAHELARKLREGQVMEVVEPSFRLREGEQEHGRFGEVTLCEWFGVDVPYKTIHNRAFHPVGWAIDATVHKAINNRNRARAEAKAAPTWRDVTCGTLHLTSQRLVLDDGLQLRSWWFQSIVGTEASANSLILRVEDDAAVLFRMSDPYVLRVALHYAAWKEIVDLPAPEYGVS